MQNSYCGHINLDIVINHIMFNFDKYPIKLVAMFSLQVRHGHQSCIFGVV